MRVLRQYTPDTVIDQTQETANQVGKPAVAATSGKLLTLVSLDDFRPTMGVIIRIAYPVGWQYRPNRKRDQ